MMIYKKWSKDVLIQSNNLFKIIKIIALIKQLNNKQPLKKLNPKLLNKSI